MGLRSDRPLLLNAWLLNAWLLDAWLLDARLLDARLLDARLLDAWPFDARLLGHGSGRTESDQGKHDRK
jgi:hypothetical protein